jgi:hypothetical protein
MSGVLVSDRGHADKARLRQGLIALALLIVVVLMLRNLGALLVFACNALSYPYSFDYGEGIVWQQMRDMLQGAAYGPLGIYPAIVYHYPPVFHLTAAATAALSGADELAAGRAVELASSLVTAVLVASLTMLAMGRELSVQIRAGCGAAAALMFLSCGPVIAWTPLMRVDMLAGALGLFGLVFTIRAIDRPAWIYAASVAFVLSLYTKQIGIAAPMAAFAVLLLVDRRTALRGLAASTLLGLIILGALSWMTDGGFVRHIFMYNVNRLDLSRLANLASGVGAHLPLVLLAAAGAAYSWQLVRQTAGGTLNLQSVRAVKGDRVAFASLVLLTFLAIKTLMLPAILKSGSNQNYLIEWLSALAVFAGIAMHQVFAAALGRGSSRPDRSPLLLALAVPIALMPLVLSLEVSSQQMEARAAKLAPLVARIAAAPRPVIADDMALLIRAGRRVDWEPAIAAELAHTGVYDEAAFVRLIRAGEFAFFVTEEKIGTKAFNERYNAAVVAAIKEVYPLQEEVGGFILHLPRQ